ncbi:MAG TPA: hypothetical protein VFQ61_18315 [Polyangiaceae bacterium]|nr:hypothetical protein [Polyangiaceae bacterium]
MALPSLVACGGGNPPAATPATTTNAVAAPSASASAPTVEPPKAVNAGQCLATPLLDDAEDGDNKGKVADQRGGYWYTFADSQGSSVEPKGNFQMSKPGASGSQYAARMHGKMGPSGILYAGMGFSFTDPKAPYDAACCKGLRFMAKKDGKGTGNVRLKVGDTNTTPEGGVCKSCYNDFGADLALTNDWKQYSFAFADMKQEPYWGEPQPKIESGRLMQVQWQVKEPGQEFDIWVDQVEFFDCGK